MLIPALIAAALLAAPSPILDSTLFPNLSGYHNAEIQLAGLSALYPGRVLHIAPLSPDSASTNRPPLVAELPHNYTYLRIYDLSSSLPKLAELLKNKGLIIDLRYVAATPAASNDFATTLAKAGLAASPPSPLGTLPPPPTLPSAEASLARLTGALPVIVIINNKTAGTLEAWLAAFQVTENLLTVGTTTAGQSGIYRADDNFPDYFYLTGELQPPGGSIIGTGLKPRFPVEVSPEQTYRAYFEVERTNDAVAALRRDRPAPASAAANATTNPTSGKTTATPAPAVSNITVTQTTPPAIEEAVDPALQRAVDVLSALQLLGRLPAGPASASGTAK